MTSTARFYLNKLDADGVLISDIEMAARPDNYLALKSIHKKAGQR